MKPTAYVINLDHRTDRWQRMQELWSPFFELVRWPATEVPGNGAEGCKRSHVALAEDVLKTADTVLVLEDDAVPTRKFKEVGLEIIAEAIAHVNDWDYINCGPCLDPKSTGRKRTRVVPSKSPLFMWVDFSYRTHFVIYNRRSLPLLRATLESKTELDLHLGHNARNQWVPKHVLAVQDNSPSDIHKASRESGSGYLTTEKMLTQIKPVMNKPCLVCYLPPSAVRNTQPFLANLKQCVPSLPLLLFTDSDEYDYLKPTRIKASPEVAAPNVEQLVFLTACLLAKRGGFTHMILLEHDCRMAAGFDTAIWDEYVAAGKPHAIGGTVILRHVAAMTGHAVKDAQELKARNFDRNLPVAEYGSASSPLPHKPSVTVCAPLGVYPIALMDELFQFSAGKTVEVARKMPSVGREMGERLWALHEGAVFDYVVQLNSIFSTHHDQVTDEDTRCGWLNERKIIAVHPVKSGWVPEQISVQGGSAVAGSSLSASGVDRVTPLQSPADPALLSSPASTGDTGKDAREASGQADARTASKPTSETAKPEAPVVQTVTAPSLPSSFVIPPVNLKACSAVPNFPYRVDILIVTRAAEADWLTLCLKSIGRFCRGFGAITIVFPPDDHESITPAVSAAGSCSYDISLSGDNGAVLQTCMADLHCPDADLVMHVDAHCIFFQPVSAEDYFHSGKPTLLMTPYEQLRDTNKAHFEWKENTESVFKEPVHYSTMEGFPILHWREAYPAMRSFVELRQGTPFHKFVTDDHRAFTLLGAYVLRSKEFIDRYHFVNLSRVTRPKPKLIEFVAGGLDDQQKAPTALPATYPIATDGTIVPKPIINNILTHYEKDYLPAPCCPRHCGTGL